MSLAQEDIEFIKQHLGEWLTEVSLGKQLSMRLSCATWYGWKKHLNTKEN